MEPSIEDIAESLHKHAKIFDDLLRLIPPKFYLAEENEKAINHRFMKNIKKETNAKQKDAERKSRAAIKAERLDPENIKTVQDIQAEKFEQQQQEKKAKANGTSDNVHMSKMDIDLDSDKEEDKEITPMAAPGSISALREKLQARIQSLRQKRKAPEDDVSREALLEKRMKRRKSTKEAKAKAKKAGSAAREQVLGGKTPNGNGANEEAGESSEGNIYFGRLTTGMIKKKSKKGMGAKQQLAKVESRRKEIEELRKEDAAKAEMLEQKDQWNKVLDMAKGEKVKDDAKLLRKTIRRNEQQKKKSSREWNERKNKVATQIKERVEKRDANIKARAEAKKMKKQGKSKKAIERTLQATKKGSGKARPGFEGKAARK
ncbi:hypothetical protein IWW36_001378 [Coemansia brasiliensis]|uniref:SURF6-domain-containing protein n=1 Tax=Coemansia brasiliensis TaxID=2650707 RepID=A0A9W8I942_9FUNG|nr:hypothetical protein IWW36_001378 [Coemansia brasiliensis]